MMCQEAVQMVFNSKSVTERLLQLSMRTGYSYFQKNGQRIYGCPPDWVGPPPERGSEVFIGRLPRDLFEDELVPVFESIAPLYELRMMMNFTGLNRGFAFVMYKNPRDAWQAVITLNNYEIRPGHKIGVSKSIDNCRLYIGGIPMDKTKTDAFEEIAKIIPTVKDIIMYPCPETKHKNRGFFFVEFDTHRSAAMAKKLLAPGAIKLWNQEVIIDWADPEPDVDPYIMSTITKLFIRSLKPEISTDCIRRILESVVGQSAVQRIYVSGHYGFIHFNNRVNAQKAKEKLSTVAVNGEYLEVQWARPKCYKKHPTTFNKNRCVLPPRLKNLEMQTSVPNNNYEISTPYYEYTPIIPPQIHYTFCR